MGFGLRGQSEDRGEGEYEQGHHGLLEGALGEERRGQERQPGQRGRDDPGGWPQVAEERERRERRQGGDRDQKAVEGIEEGGPGGLGDGRHQGLRAHRVAPLDRAGLPAQAVLQPVGPVELRPVVVGVDALAQDARPSFHQERNHRRDEDDHNHGDPGGVGPGTAARAALGRRAQRTPRHDHANKEQGADAGRGRRRAPGHPDQQGGHDGERGQPDGSLDPDRPSGAEQVHDEPPRQQREDDQQRSQRKRGEHRSSRPPARAGGRCLAARCRAAGSRVARRSPSRR